MDESKEVKILRFPNRHERRANLAKAKVRKIPDAVETVELTEADVERIHGKGSPHQHLDPTPHKIYDETVEELPRYLRRAFESRSEVRVEACINKALREGWSMDALVKAMHKFTFESSPALS
jgi:hypothetical protein